MPRSSASWPQSGQVYGRDRNGKPRIHSSPQKNSPEDRVFRYGEAAVHVVARGEEREASLYLSVGEALLTKSANIFLYKGSVSCD